MTTPQSGHIPRSLRPLLLGGVVTVLLLVLLAGCRSTPRFQGMEAQQIYEMGMQDLEDEEWDDAIEAFEQLLSTAPGFPRRAEARFSLAQAHYGKEEYILAANEYELFLMRHPMHALAPQASLGVCRSYQALAPIPPRDQEYTRRAETACRQTANEFQGTEVAEEAARIREGMTDRLAEKWYLEGRFYQRRNMHPSALIIFQDVVDYYPQTRWAPRAMLRLYRSYEEMGWTEEMNEAAQRLLMLYPDSDEARRLSEERADGNGPSGGG